MEVIGGWWWKLEVRVYGDQYDPRDITIALDEWNLFPHAFQGAPYILYVPHYLTSLNLPSPLRKLPYPMHNLQRR